MFIYSNLSQMRYVKNIIQHPVIFDNNENQ